jgi:acetyl-CoA C-acetyltransferase
MSFGNNGNGEIVISTPLRTGIGTFGGALKDVAATDLGATVSREVLSRSDVEGEQVDQVIVGNILSAGQGMNPGRQVGIKSGLPVEVPGMTLNRMCGSGLQAIVSAAQEIALGDADVVLAGGIENMDRAPFLLPKGRYGYRMGMPKADIYDHLVFDGLWDVFNDYHMGVTAENVAEKYGITREESDAYAVRSHQRAAQAHEEEQFEGQIVPVEIKQKKETVQFTDDEHIRTNASVEGLGKLKPVFKKDGGTVTAGNSSGINDGAALMLVSSDRKAEELGLPVAGRLVSAAVAGVDPSVMGTGRYHRGRPGRRRGERGLRLHSDRRRTRAGGAGGEAQPRGRRGRPRAPDRGHRRRPDRQGPPPPRPHGRPLRPRYPLHRRGYGYSRHLRASVDS